MNCTTVQYNILKADNSSRYKTHLLPIFYTDEPKKCTTRQANQCLSNAFFVVLPKKLLQLYLSHKLIFTILVYLSVLQCYRIIQELMKNQILLFLNKFRCLIFARCKPGTNNNCYFSRWLFPSLSFLQVNKAMLITLLLSLTQSSLYLFIWFICRQFQILELCNTYMYYHKFIIEIKI